MSHITKIELEIKDLDALKAAGEALGLKFNRDQKQFRWFAGKQNPCEHAFSAPNTQYEIGVVRSDNGYKLELDFFGGLGKILGKNADKLKQGYAVEVASRAAMRQGYKIRKAVQEDGTVVLRGVAR